MKVKSVTCCFWVLLKKTMGLFIVCAKGFSQHSDMRKLHKQHSESRGLARCPPEQLNRTRICYEKEKANSNKFHISLLTSAIFPVLSSDHSVCFQFYCLRLVFVFE